MRRFGVENFAERMLCGLTEGKEGLSSELPKRQGDKSGLERGDPQVSFKGKQTIYRVRFLETRNKGRVTNLRLSGQLCQQSQKICQSWGWGFLFFFFPHTSFYDRLTI